MILDLLRGLARVGVVPGRILVDLIAYHDVVVTRLSLPMTEGVSFAIANVFRADRRYWKVVVSFDNNRLLALRKSCAFPYCFHD